MRGPRGRRAALFRVIHRIESESLVHSKMLSPEFINAKRPFDPSNHQSPNMNEKMNNPVAKQLTLLYASGLAVCRSPDVPLVNGALALGLSAPSATVLLRSLVSLGAHPHVRA